MRIALFVTCLTDTLFPEAGQAVVRLLERLGHEVAFPTGQTCCGQMHFNTGYQDQAMPMVRGFAEAFGGYEAIVTPSASCAAMIHEYHPMLAAKSGDQGLVRAVDAIVGRVHELSVLLTDVLGVTDVGATFPRRVTYHASCHSLRLLRIGDAPLRLLRAVRGLDLAELPDADVCCGFGGTFSVKNPDVSAAMAADKCAAVLSTGADVVCAADSSCLMHIGGTLRRSASLAGKTPHGRAFPAGKTPYGRAFLAGKTPYGSASVTTMHLAEILAAT